MWYYYLWSVNIQEWTLHFGAYRIYESSCLTDIYFKIRINFLLSYMFPLNQSWVPTACLHSTLVLMFIWNSDSKWKVCVMLCPNILYCGPYIMYFIKFFKFINQNYIHLMMVSVDLHYQIYTDSFWGRGTHGWGLCPEDMGGGGGSDWNSALESELAVGLPA